MSDFVFGMDAYDFMDNDWDTGDLTTLEGDGNSPPLQTSNTPQRSNTLLDLLGSIGSTARDLGTAVGKTTRDIKSADNQFKAARDAQIHGNSMSTWWQYTSTTDKVMIGLGVAGLALVFWKGGK